MQHAHTGGSSVRHSLSKQDVAQVVGSTAGYSASDLTALCREAALGPVRDLGPAIADVSLDRIRPVRLGDFANALQVCVAVCAEAWRGQDTLPGLSSGSRTA